VLTGRSDPATTFPVAFSHTRVAQRVWFSCSSWPYVPKPPARVAFQPLPRARARYLSTPSASPKSVARNHLRRSSRSSPTASAHAGRRRLPGTVASASSSKSVACNHLRRSSRSSPTASAHARRRRLPGAVVDFNPSPVVSVNATPVVDVHPCCVRPPPTPPVRAQAIAGIDGVTRWMRRTLPFGHPPEHSRLRVAIGLDCRQGTLLKSRRRLWHDCRMICRYTHRSHFESPSLTSHAAPSDLLLRPGVQH
jgi:hypothetical protein